MLKLVVRVNARRDKVPALLEVREEVESLKAVLRLAHDTQAFASLRSFEHAVVLARGGETERGVAQAPAATGTGGP